MILWIKQKADLSDSFTVNVLTVISPVYLQNRNEKSENWLDNVQITLISKFLLFY